MNDSKATTYHEHHRQRMRLRVQEQGLESLQEHEVLEYLLYFALPRVDTKEIAYELLHRFGGSICNVLEATEEELCSVKGVGAKSAELIHIILPLARYYAQHKRNPRAPLDSFQAATAYLRPLFEGLQEECFYVIALDDGGCPLRDLLVAKGLPNHVQFDTGALLRQAINTRCTYALLAHNHTAGPAQPSPEDIRATAQIVGLFGPVGITVLDHIIITPSDACSLLRIGELPRYDRAEQRVVPGNSSGGANKK